MKNVPLFVNQTQQIIFPTCQSKFHAQNRSSSFYSCHTEKVDQLYLNYTPFPWLATLFFEYFTSVYAEI
jgi:hypothetical protein